MKVTDIEKKELTNYIELFDYDSYLKDKRILITGSKGLVGTGLVKWILFQNQLKGTNTKILASTRNPNDLPDYIEKSDNIKYVKHGTENSIDEKIDYIVHAASPTGNKYHMQHPIETFKINVDGVEKMLDIAARNDGCSMIYLSLIHI